jgi:hypothetical protein
MKEPADLWVGIFTFFMKTGSHGYTVEPSMVIKTNALQTSPTMASPGPLLVMLNNPQQGMCALLPFHRWFSSLKINFKLILARFQ